MKLFLGFFDMNIDNFDLNRLEKYFDIERKDTFSSYPYLEISRQISNQVKLFGNLRILYEKYCLRFYFVIRENNNECYQIDGKSPSQFLRNHEIKKGQILTNNIDEIYLTLEFLFFTGFVPLYEKPF